MTGALVVAEVLTDLQCIRLFVISAGRIVRYLLGQPVVNQFTVAVVLKITEILNPEDQKAGILIGLLILREDKCLM